MKTELCLSSRSVDLVDSMLSRSKTALPEATEFGCVNGSSFNKDSVKFLRLCASSSELS